jgi:hypothetical protein
MYKHLSVTNNSTLLNKTLYPLIGLSVFFLFGIFFLSKGFPSEDAFILFRYVYNFNETGIISFNPNGIPTEGATDFLWLVLLSLISFFGVDPMISSIIINSIGVFLILKVSFELFPKNFNSKYLFLCVPLVFSFSSPISFASYVGFSTSMYFFLIMYTYITAIKNQRVLWTLSYITVILFRPEAILLVSSSFLILIKDFNIPNLIKHQINLIIPFLIGLIYFFWRYCYFGNLFPLPFYVKSIGPNEIYRNLLDFYFLLRNNISLIFLILIIISSLILNYRKFKQKILLPENYKPLLYIILTLIIYFLIMVFGHKSQNVYNRYELPFIVFLYLSYLYVIKNFTTNRIIKLLSILYIIFSIVNLKYFLDEDTRIDDLAKVSISLNNELKNEENFKFLLTEAGVLTFWNPKFKILDLAGLNNNFTSQNPINSKLIEGSGFDLIELDLFQDDFFNRTMFISDMENKCGTTDLNIFLNYLKPDFELLFQKGIISYEESDFPTTKVALINTFSYLLKNPTKYKIFYTQGRDQVYIYQKKSKFLKEIERSFERVCNDSFSPSYLKNRFNLQ